MITDTRGCLVDCQQLFQAGHFQDASQKLQDSKPDCQNILDMILLTNNSTLCNALKLLSADSKETSFTELQHLEDQFKATLNKIKSVPVSRNFICAEVYVLYNFVFIKLLKPGSSLEDSVEKLFIETLGRVLRCTAKSPQYPQTRDFMTLIIDSFQALARSSFPDVDILLDGLVNLCCLRSIWLFLSDRKDDAISCLTACSRQRSPSLQVHFAEEIGSSNKVKMAMLPLIFPLSLLMNGEISTDTDVNKDNKVNFILGLMYFKINNTQKCRDCLDRVTYKPWVPFTKYILGYIEYSEGRFLEALAILGHTNDANCDIHGNQDGESNMDLGHDTHRIKALSQNVVASCLSKMGKPYCAIQKYKEALQTDFTCLQPLYNISLEYRKMGLYDAELESLNLMTMALESSREECTSREDNSLMNMVLRDTEENITYVHAVYMLANRCLQLKRYDMASQWYMDLIKNFNQSDIIQVDSDRDMKLPSVQKIYIETIYSLLHAEKHNDCIIICDRLLICNVKDNSQKLTQTQDSTGYDSVCEAVASSSKKRLRSVGEDGVAEKDTSTESDKLLILLYKTKALIHLGKLSDAVNCLERVTDILQTSPLVGKKHVEDEISHIEPKPKRQRISSEGASVSKQTDHEDNVSHDVADIKNLASRVYGHMGAALATQKKYHDALHFLRISLQLDQDSQSSLYNLTQVLWSCDCQREAVIGWCTARGVETKSDTFQLANLLKQKQNSLKLLKDSDLDTDLSPGDVVPDSEVNECQLLKLDVMCLHYLMKLRQKSSYKW